MVEKVMMKVIHNRKNKRIYLYFSEGTVLIHLTVRFQQSTQKLLQMNLLKRRYLKCVPNETEHLIEEKPAMDKRVLLKVCRREES